MLKGAEQKLRNIPSTSTEDGCKTFYSQVLKNLLVIFFRILYNRGKYLKLHCIDSNKLRKELI